MGAAGDILQLTNFSTYKEQMCLNVFHYRLEDVPAAGFLEGLATEFNADVLPTIKAIQSSQVHHIFQQVINLFNPLELFEWPLNEFGTWAGSTSDTGLPPFMANAFKLVRSNLTVRNGRKHFAGVDEAMSTGGAASAGLVALVDDVEAALAQELVAGAVDHFKPVIVKRVPYVTAEGNDSFRLPESQIEMGANWSYVAYADYRGISTMNSRKVGRGI